MVWLVEENRLGHALLKRRLEIAWRHLFFHSFDHTLKEVCLSDGIMSAYLGGLKTAASDVGGPTVAGPNTTF